MPPSRASTPHTLRPYQRLLLVLVGAGLAVLAVLAYLRDERQEERWIEIARERLTGSLRLEQIERLQREPDPDRGGLSLARALVVEALEAPTNPPPVARDGAPRGDIENSESDLALARRLTGEARAALPAAWEGPMLDGAATYLEWSQTRDPRLVLEAERWQQPLYRSLELAPGESEPNRFLAAAYLELWPVLSEERRSDARQALRQAFEDEATFRRLVRPWLERADSRSMAFRLIPRRPWAWDQLRTIYAEEQDWRNWRRAHEEWRQALLAELDDDLQEADERLRGGDPRSARQLYFQIVHRAPATPEGDALSNSALLHCPPSVASRIYVNGLRQRLERALDLSLLRTSPLEPQVVARLAQAVPELDPALAAHAALMAGDLPQGRLLERRHTNALWDDQWGPYFIAKARVLSSRGDFTGAEQALGLVHAVWKTRLPYWRARQEQARGNADGELLRLAEDQLLRFAARRQPATAWHRSNTVSKLEWVATEEASAVELGFQQVPAVGAVVEIRIDGWIVATEAISSSSRLRIPATLAAGQDHLLEVVTLTAGTVAPGEVFFTPAPGARGTTSLAG
ncbi:MAG: hypothetical protein SX243_04830 [Acidobacteriota bacterium]|nr:hypothetical protein [Acidobacteriota bacterium]